MENNNNTEISNKQAKQRNGAAEIIMRLIHGAIIGLGAVLREYQAECFALYSAFINR